MDTISQGRVPTSHTRLGLKGFLLTATRSGERQVRSFPCLRRVDQQRRGGTRCSDARRPRGAHRDRHARHVLSSAEDPCPNSFAVRWTNSGVPGGSVAVMADGEVDWARPGYGFADVDWLRLRGINSGRDPSRSGIECWIGFDSALANNPKINHLASSFDRRRPHHSIGSAAGKDRRSSHRQGDALSLLFHN